MLLLLKGILIGVANVIPGVSGGTIAVILNIYDQLTEAIGNFFLVDFKKKKEYFKFLFTVILGAAIGVFIFSKLIKYSITNYPIGTSLVLTALIIPSIPYIVKGLDYKKSNNILCFFMGLIVTSIFIFLNFKFNNSTVNEAITTYTTIEISYAIKLIICGLVAAGAMIVPGVSGALVLLVLGEYYNILSYISSMNILPLIVFSIGVCAGLVIFSKLLNILLNKYRETTLFFLSGMITMSLVQMWIIML